MEGLPQRLSFVPVVHTDHRPALLRLSIPNPSTNPSLHTPITCTPRADAIALSRGDRATHGNANLTFADLGVVDPRLADQYSHPRKFPSR